MSFKFVLGQQVVTAASEATGATTKDVGGLFMGQGIINTLHIANTGSSTADYTVAASGVNTTIVTATSFSLDNISYTSSVMVSGVTAGTLSEIIFYKIAPAQGDVVGSGTVFLRADEVVV